MLSDSSADQGHIGAGLVPEVLSVVPGSSGTARLLLSNLGPEEDYVQLSVTDIPTNWVSVPSPTVRLASGEQREVNLILQPPPPPLGRAGQYAFTVGAASQHYPGKVAQVGATLTVAALAVPGRMGRRRGT